MSARGRSYRLAGGRHDHGVDTEPVTISVVFRLTVNLNALQSAVTATRSVERPELAEESRYTLEISTPEPNSAYLQNLSQTAAHFNVNYVGVCLFWDDGGEIRGSTRFSLTALVCADLLEFNLVRSCYYGVYLNSASNIILTGNILYANGKDGMNLGDSSGDTVTLNNSYANGGNGFTIGGSNDKIKQNKCLSKRGQWY